MIEIDGSEHSGSGTLLRYAVSLCTLIGEPLHMYRIRAKRQKPGLRPQHLQALRACCSLSSGSLEGDEVDTQEIYYSPGTRLEGGNHSWDIGTAGSTTMLAFSVIPLALYSRRPSVLTITGGLFQDFAPSAFHTQQVLLPLIGRMGGEVQLEIDRPGYVPKGQGRLSVRVQPISQPLTRLKMMDRGDVKRVHGISLASHLAREKVGERMADACLTILGKHDYRPHIEVVNDDTAVQKGAALCVWAETDTGCLLGADQAGKPGRRSESIAGFVANSLLDDLNSGASTDRHLADQLILFAALAKDRTEYVIPRITDHVHSNLWLVDRILGAQSRLEDRVVTINGIGLKPSMG